MQRRPENCAENIDLTAIENRSESSYLNSAKTASWHCIALPADAASRGHGCAAQLFANGFPAKLPWIAENAFRRGSCLRFSVLADVCAERQSCLQASPAAVRSFLRNHCNLECNVKNRKYPFNPSVIVCKRLIPRFCVRF